MPVERKHEMGAGGRCVCPKCEKTLPHQSGIRCIDVRCPDCGVKMVREGSEHHQKIMQKKGKA